MLGNRLGRNVVALAASAITAVYVAGYVHTEAADASLGAPAATPSMTSAPAAGQAPAVTTTNPVPTSTARPANTAPSGQAAASRAASQPGPSLKDGTYTGVGTSRRGDVQVSLTVQGGRVASVNITGANTQYPTRFIANLPGEVVSRQSAQIDIVSGATYSSLAFRGAVQQALQRAQG
jgi:uncharacterized protein with FMN-binding domain